MFFIEVMIAIERLLNKPEDLKARCQLSYLGAIALSGFLNRPRGGDFPLHMMQHPLSGYFDISHGRGLALLFPRWLKYVCHEKPAKIIQFGERVFSMDLETHHPLEAAELVIERLIEWLDEIGAYFYLDDLGIPNDPTLLMKLAEDVIRINGDENGTIGGIKRLGVDDIFTIYESCIRIGTPEVQMPLESLEEHGEEASDETVETETDEQPSEIPTISEDAIPAEVSETDKGGQIESEGD